MEGKVNFVEKQVEVARMSNKKLLEDVFSVFDEVQMNFRGEGVVYLRRNSVWASEGKDYLVERAMKILRNYWIHYSEALKKFQNFSVKYDVAVSTKDMTVNFDRLILSV